jgi:hypothetical protein
LESDFVCPGCGATEILLDDILVDMDIRAQISEYIDGWEKKKSINQAGNENVSSFIRKSYSNSQMVLSPSVPSRKRSRSPTSGDDPDNKKRTSRDPISKSQNLPNSPPMAPAISNDPNSQSLPYQQHQHQQQQQQSSFDNMPFMPGMPGMPGIPFPPFPPDPFMMAAMGFPPMPEMIPHMDPGMYYQQGYNQQMENQVYGGYNNTYTPRGPNDRRGKPGYWRNH